MGFKESTDYPMLQDILSSYFYAGDEEAPTPAELAETVSADCPPGEVLALRDEIGRFLHEAGPDADERFRQEFLSYYSPPGDGYPVRDWLQTLAAGLEPRPKRR